jgi:hypothetical protein
MIFSERRFPLFGIMLQSYCVITTLSLHPEELELASLSKDEARK